MTSENEYTDADGVRYVAKPKEKCIGCVAEHRVPLCLALPICGRGIREDATDVIWVKDEAGEQA